MLANKDKYRGILIAELIPALGCTEPIALALAAAKARETINVRFCDIDRIDVYCSGNIVKNVMGVVVPNSGGARGIDIAVAMGITGGDSNRGLEVLCSITSEQISMAKTLCDKEKIKIHVVDGQENLYIKIEIFSGLENAAVEILEDHTRINRVVKNGEVLIDNVITRIPNEDTKDTDLTLSGIIEYATKVDLDNDKELVQVLERQILYNSSIAKEGISKKYGTEVGRTILEMGDKRDFRTRVKAYTAAASDARMGGSSFPVIINSGSGNQGLTVSVPVIEFASEICVKEETLFRALIISNLLAVHQKRYIGKLSAFCGVVSAAAAAGAGIAYLKGFNYDQIAMVVTNTIATIGGMICDGAKGSCASKIAQSLDNTLTAIEMAENNRVFQPGEGLVGRDVEETIQNFGRMAKIGMKETDKEILKIMIE